MAILLKLKGLEELYQKYKNHDFLALGFPSNYFNQESPKGEEIESFCKLNYGVTSPLFKAICVTGESIINVLDGTECGEKAQFLSWDGTTISW